MTKKAKVGLKDLAVVAEETLGIPQVVTVEETQPVAVTESELSQSAIQEKEIEFAYLQNQLETTQANVEYMLKRYAFAHKAAKIIKAAHAELQAMRADGERQLLAVEQELLGGVKIYEGVAIPKMSQNSDVVSRIEMFKAQVHAANTRVANIIAKDFGFDSADDLFALISVKKETVNAK